MLASMNSVARDRAGNRFKRSLGKCGQLGLFATLASANSAELLALSGFDWLVVDTEHSPNDLNDVTAQLRSIALHNVSPIVRVAWNDQILVKQLLDTGAQTLLFPYIETPDQAASAVSFTRYPPAGVRGVAGSSRAAGYGTDDGYLKAADSEICVIAQIETALGPLRSLGKPRGYLTSDLGEAKRRWTEGMDFLALGTDATLFARAARSAIVEVTS